ncbi:MAG TPA: cytochrome c [Bryobacteraceae bacterium]|jgi:mono/diheme cytochrome c family protein
MRGKLAAMGLLGLAVIGAQSPRSVWDGVYTAEQGKRGQAVYNTQCAACHGDTLGGGESAPPLAGGEFLSNWSGLTVGDLFERTRTSMPQSKPGSLSREINADILAYILSANQFPAGKTELAHATEVLKEIKIEALKPDPKQ